MAAGHPGRVYVRHRYGSRGLGRSYVEGFAAALCMGADLIVQMDADLSHDPRDLPAILAAAQDFDLVVGSRYPGHQLDSRWSRTRRWISRAANRYVQALTHMPVDDCTSGYRCWTRYALERVNTASIRSTGFSIQVEMLHAALSAGCRIGEVPIRFDRRAGGRSKLSLGIVAESIVLPWRLRNTVYCPANTGDSPLESTIARERKVAL